MRRLAFNRLEHDGGTIDGAVVLLDGERVVSYYRFEREEADTTWVGGTAKIVACGDERSLIVGGCG